MITSESECSSKKSWRRGQTPGWAAFDREQRSKSSIELECKNEPFPPISSSMLRSSNDLSLLEKPFASVIFHPVKLLRSENDDCLDNLQFPVSGCDRTIGSGKFVNQSTGERSAVKAHDMLKECHPWADESLIIDVLSGVNNDVDEASNLLKAMVSPENCRENDDLESKGLEHMSDEYSLVQGDKSPGDVAAEVVKLNHLLEEGLKFGNDEPSSYAANLSIIQNYLNSIPTEPEWEEDDVYLVHRKDALRMMRSASRHSKAANDAYLSGEHSLAQQHSLKAREEWKAAERLNDVAANKILRIRNAKNDEWTLDLHGLHAVEAVRALVEHLWKIEHGLHANQLMSAKVVEGKPSTVISAPPVSISCSDLGKLGRQPLSSRPRPKPKAGSLAVITGKGNHSRGDAAIPSAVRSFLIENGYQCDDTRPGMITVRLKFRR